ncbi:MAG: C25 family cysteine peptidase [Candidatus Woesearchaeota archaeon]
MALAIVLVLSGCQYFFDDPIFEDPSDDPDPVTGNIKESDYYLNNPVFMASSSEWREVLSLIPVAVWTDKDNNIHNYPLLSYYEGDVIDLDSIHHFLSQYEPETIRYSGMASDEIYEYLVGYNVEEHTSLLDYWASFDDIVYVKDNYEHAMIASTYASLINAPLIIEGYNDDMDFDGINVLCVGIDMELCAESYSAKEIQSIYVERTGTNKIILTNPSDLIVSSYDISGFELERTSGRLRVLYDRLSLMSPYLASAKHQLLLLTNKTDYALIDNDLKSMVSEMNVKPEYLTIFASPNMIPASRDGYNFYIKEIRDRFDGRADRWSQIDLSVYGDFSEDYQPDVAVGRIFGFTVSDVSSYLARTLFYEQLHHSDYFAAVTSHHAYANPSSELYLKSLFQTVGLKDRSTYYEWGDSFEPELYKDKVILAFSSHASWYGLTANITVNNFRLHNVWMNNPIFSVIGCSSCNYARLPESWTSPLFCTEMIRRGAVAYVGAVEDSADNINIHAHFFYYLTDGMDIGTAFKKASRLYLYDNVLEYSPYTILLGDPTFNPGMISEGKPDRAVVEQTELMSKDEGSWIMRVTANLSPIETVAYEGIRMNACSELFVNAAPDYLGEGIVTSRNVYYERRLIEEYAYYEDQGVWCPDLETHLNFVILGVKFHNPEALSLESVHNAVVIVDGEVTDITDTIGYDPTTADSSYMFAKMRDEHTYIRIPVDFREAGITTTGRDTEETPSIQIIIELLFKE